MKNYLLNFDKKLLRIIRTVGREADHRKLSAYIVGGTVRDILLKKKNLDLDFSIEGDAIALAKALAKKTKARLTVYKQFKTASLQWSGGICVDLATVRKERYAHSGALPMVQVGTLQEDLLRRDFTINAMALAINAEYFGQLIDEFGGLEDLSNKKIKVLHEKSFNDDPTRILRAVRFEQRFNFQIERKTLLWLKLALKRNDVAHVKPPRYFAEFKKILCENNPIKSLKRLYKMGGLQFLNSQSKFRFQGLSSIHGRIQKLKQKSLYKGCDYWWFVYLIGLIGQCPNRDIMHIIKTFHFSKIEQKSIQQICEVENFIKRLSSKRLMASRIYQILKPQTEELISYLRVRTSNVLVHRRIDRYLSNDSSVRLQINGDDLKKIGIPSGFKMGQVLENVLCSKIDRQIKSKGDELKKALHFMGK